MEVKLRPLPLFCVCGLVEIPIGPLARCVPAVSTNSTDSTDSTDRGLQGTYRYLHQTQNRGSGLYFASNPTYQKLAPKFSIVVS